jgi:hypothetical protein
VSPCSGNSLSYCFSSNPPGLSLESTGNGLSSSHQQEVYSLVCRPISLMHDVALGTQ